MLHFKTVRNWERMNESKESSQVVSARMELRKDAAVGREIVTIYIACGLAVIAAWVLSFWELTPPLVETWTAIVLGEGNFFWVCGLVATNVVAYILARSSKEAWLTMLLGLSIFALSFVVHPSQGALYERLLQPAKWFGIFGLCALAYQARRPGGVEIFLTALCFSLFVPISVAYLAMTSSLRPDTMDLHAYAFDRSLGIGVAPYVFTLFRRSGLVSTIAIAAYVSLLGAYVVLSGLQARFADRSVVPALRIFLLAAGIGFACYFIFPVVGPRNFFGDNYPFHLPDFSQFTVGWSPAIPTARNGMPSLHFAWALLLVLNVPRSLPYAKAAFALFCFLTALATLGTGEHYFVDLVAALPFAAMVQAIGLWVSHEGSRRGLMSSALRSGTIFVLSLILIAISPQWLHTPLCSWFAVAFLCLHVLGEIASQKGALETATNNVRA